MTSATSDERVGPLTRRALRAAALASAPAATLGVLALAAAIRFDLLPLLRGPAPYPPEWQWGYRPGAPGSAPAALCAALLVASLAWSASARAERRPLRSARLLLAAASVLAALVHVSVLQREPQGALRALLSRAASPSITSYHTVAVSEAAGDPFAFVREHARLLPTLAARAKHAATHPPGPVLWYRAALALCERWPALADALLDAAGVPRTPSQSDRGRAARASALLGALGLAALAALAVWPIALLGEALGLEALAAARLAALWAVLPGPALMSPPLDAALALPVTACAAILAGAVGAGRPASGALRALGAGACGGLALFTSYGSAAFLALASGAALAARIEDRRGLARAGALAGLAALAAATLAFGVPWLLGGDPVAALRTALAIHRSAYTEPRSYALWLAFNPLDFAVFVGPPVALAALLAARRSLVLARAGQAAPLDRFRLAVAGGMALLLLLGVTRGEVGRLWIPLMPLVLVAGLGATSHGQDARRALWHALALTLLTLAIGSCWVV